MEQAVVSFTIDHINMSRGIFVSRVDKVGDEMVTTFDIRMKEPNREPVLDIAALHAIEHLGATYFRSHPEWDARTIYFGPMGCRTGNYLILGGEYTSLDVKEVITGMFEYVRDFEGEIPGAAAKDCGNYLNHDLAMAQWESKRFLDEVLYNFKDENMSYPE